MPATEAGQRKRARILAFVRSFRAANGFPPSFEEIRAACGLSSKSHVSYYLDDLEAAGLLRRERKTYRTVQAVGEAL